MSVVNLLASALGHRDDDANILLAQNIAKKKDKLSVKELIDVLEHKNKALQSDAIKTIYELSALDGSLVLPYAKVFVELLRSKNNRMQWGAMAALAGIAAFDSEKIYPFLSEIITVANSGSVITRDNAVRILVSIAGVKKHYDETIALLKDQLLSSPPNQLPMYAEMVLPLVQKRDVDLVIDVLTLRKTELGTESKKKRVDVVVKKLRAV